MPSKPLILAALVLASPLFSGCGGGGTADLTGTWSSDGMTLTVFKDAKFSLTFKGGSCAGTAKRQGDAYELPLDCGVGKDIITAKLKDHNTLTIVDNDGTGELKRRKKFAGDD